MKRVAIISSLETAKICSSAGCFKALNNRTASFERYKDEEIEVVAFFNVDDTNLDFEEDEKFYKKINRLIEAKPDVIHIAVCLIKKSESNSAVKESIEAFEKAGIEIVVGTH